MAQTQTKMTSGKEPRWTYAKPTEKSQPKMAKKHWDGVQTETSAYTRDYNLPVIDVDKQRRNFQGYVKENFVTQAELTDHVGDTWGTTETDSATDPKGLPGYSKINKMRSVKASRWNTRRS